jgi:ferredoxin-type protein NapF
MAQAIDHSRRNLLLGLRQSTPPPVRPPWTSETSIAEACTHCGACAEACGPGLISLGAGGLPALDFTAGECTFCAACADACPEPVFPDVAERKRAFSHVVAIGSTTAASPCLTHRGVVCQTCRDECPEAAIRFAFRIGGPAVPQVVEDLCTGCGACIAACPADAIEISRRAA